MLARLAEWRVRIEKPETEQPEPEQPEKPPEKPEIVAVNLDYSQDWTLELTGRFKRDGRIIRTGGIRDGIDLFWWHGATLNLRLYDQLIRFTEGRVGNDYAIHRPNDHWAQSVPGVRLRDTSELVLEYEAAGRVRLFANGELVLDFGFRVNQMPPVRTELWLIGFEGEVRQK